MNPTRLSIIIPVYNAAKTLKSTLESIICQNFSGLECWIIDGKSGDNTAEIARKYCTKYDFMKMISEADRGIYDAMNKGIALSKGDYLYFMGSDDVFYNETVLNDLFSNPFFGQDDLIYGDSVYKHSRIRHGSETDYLHLIKNLENINHQCIFYSRKVFALVGQYDLRFAIYADFNLNVRCFKDDRISKRYISFPVCIFNEKGASFFNRDKDNYIKVLHELYVKQHEDPVALYDTVQYMEGQIKKLLSSRDYVVGKKIGDVVRKIRRLLNL